MLEKDQEIVYFRNDQEVARLTADNTRRVEWNLASYVRGLQPFTEVGNSIGIPQPDGRAMHTSSVREVRREGDSLHLSTRNSRYRIDFVHIDLERVLADGKWKGVNAQPTPNSLPSFPYK